MTQWWNSLSDIQHFFAIVAVPATIILFLQTLMLLFGIAGHDGDSDNDFSHDEDFSHEHDHEMHDAGLRIFTVRAFVAFFTIFGWLGLSLTNNNVNTSISIIISSCAGFLAMLFIAYVMKMATKLQSSGNIEPKNAIGKTGTVYLTIPEKRSGKGKVTILIQERLSEMEAVTDNEYKLKSGTQITVVSVSNQGILSVIPTV